MIPLVSEAIQTYADALSTPEPELFAELARETRATQKDPQMMVGNSEALLLRFLVMITRAHRVLEIGTFTGYSALAMASGLPDDGELITCDINPATTALARKYWARSSHGKKIHLKLAPASDTIAALKGQFDFVFIDADKTNYIRYWESVVPLVHAGGVIVADNVLWSGRVLDPHSENDHAVVAFNVHVRNDIRVDQVMLPIRDGVTVAVKR